MMKIKSRPSIVILVDSKTRDLPQASLIAYHLDALEVDAHLEPLEAFRGVLAAWRPELILFNHLTASHLATYSRRLAKMGVLTAVLPNEGISYDPGNLKFDAGKFHSDAHIDLFFCWNEQHAQALRDAGFENSTRIEVVGVPRFDYYFEPWSRLYRKLSTTPRPRPRLLLCTNFVTAKYAELPCVEGDKFFASWKDRIPIYRDYWPAIHAHHRGRTRLLDFLRVLVADGRWDIVLRPHPREQADFYEDFLATLPPEQRGRVELNAHGGITELILDCDLEISVETCTTALESWIAGKPTVEIDLEKHPLWHMEEQSRCGQSCEEPSRLAALVAQTLSLPAPPALATRRRTHLEKWCDAPNGTSSERLARVIAEALTKKKPADWSQLNLQDWRRSAKLRIVRRLGHAYHFDPLMSAKVALFPKKYSIKAFAYDKTIRPGDVAEARDRLEQCLG